MNESIFNCRHENINKGTGIEHSDDEFDWCADCGLIGPYYSLADNPQVINYLGKTEPPTPFKQEEQDNG